MSFGGFGSTGFGSNSNQQSGGLFGSGSGGGFGSSNNNNTGGGFGSSTGGLFGSSNTNTNNSGSLFGGGANTSNSGFGGGTFGSTNSNNNTTNSSSPFSRPFGSNNNTATGGLFGNNVNTTTSGGFGGFGSNTNTNSGSLFGGGNANNTTNNSSSGGLFGQPSSNTGGFGTGNTSSLFGGGSSTGGFGSNANTLGGGPSGFGSSQTPESTQNNGTGNIPFQVNVEKDNNQTNNFQTITMMPAYRNFSLEELRVVDYNQGRQRGNGNFGQPAFGSNNTNTGGGLFSGGSQFGSAANTNTNNTNTGFGASTNSGLFGNKTSGFGAPAPNTTTGGLFGASNNSNTSGFGGNNTSSPFGNNQSKPGGLFGTTPSNTGTSAFGNSTNTTNQQGGGIFGSSQPNNTSSTFGGFGASTNNQQPAQNNSGGGLFGGGFGNNNQNQQKPSLFGSANTNTGTSLFGSNNQQNQPSTTSLFGGSTNNQTNTNSLFGNKPGTPQSSLFGGGQNNTSNTGFGLGVNNTNSGSTLFGNNNNNQQAKPSLFGNTTTNAGTGVGTSLFGNTGTNQQANNSGSLFSQPTQQFQSNNSLFGTPAQQQQQQQQQQLVQQTPQHLSASLVSPYGHEQLFANLGTPQQAVGPLATPLSSSQKTRKPMPIPAYRLNPSASTRLITPQKRSAYGFSYSTYGTPGSAYNSPSGYSSVFSPSGSIGRTLNKSLSANNLRGSFDSGENLLNPHAFTPGARYHQGSGSMKRLHIDRRIDTNRNFWGTENTNDVTKPSPLKKAVSFGDTDSPQANGDASKALVRIEDRESETPTPEDLGFLRSSQRSLSKSTGSNGTTTSEEGTTNRAAEMNEVRGNELSVVHENESEATPPTFPQATASIADDLRLQNDQKLGDYYMVPTKEELQAMPRRSLSHLVGFVVGRKGAGKIEFDEVNLDGIDLDAICGKIVILEIRHVQVYSDTAAKPPLGKGLNFPATITLENSWPRSHGGKKPVFERKGPKFEKHLERLRDVNDTEFVDYEKDTGRWIFRVPHFSTYELNYTDDEGGLDSSMLSAPPTSSVIQHVQDLNEATDVSMMSNGASTRSSKVEDTFEFRHRGRLIPGSFDEVDDVYSGDELDQLDDQKGGVKSSPAQNVAYQAHDTSPEVEDYQEDEDTGFDGANDSPSSEHSYVPASKPRSILKTSQLHGSVFGTPKKNSIYDDTWAEQLQRTLSPKKQDRQALRESQGTFLRDRLDDVEIQPRIKEESRPFRTSIDIMNSLFGKDAEHKSSTASQSRKWPYSKKNSSSFDPSTMNASDQSFHQSTKPHWSSRGRVITISSPSLSSGEQVRLTAVAEPVTPSQSFHYLRSLSTVRSSSDQSPVISIPGSFTFGDFAHLTPSLSANATLTAERDAFQLLQVLFDPLDKSTAQDQPAMERKQTLLQFWKTLCAEQAQRRAQNAPNAEERALAFLSGWDIESATEALIQGRDYRLSTLIAQIGAGDHMRNSVADQLEVWRERNDIAEIPPRIRALYELCAGNVCVSQGSSASVVGIENLAETFGISAKLGLSWKESFGLRLWYGTTTEERIDKAVGMFQEDLQEHRESIAPVPWFVESQNQEWNDDAPFERVDLLWIILQIFTATLQKDPKAKQQGLNSATCLLLDPANSSPKGPLDATQAFVIYQALVARGILPEPRTPPERNAADALTTTLIAQLAARPVTLPDAVFVAAHLTVPSSRATSIRNLLDLHASVLAAESSSSELFDTLTSTLGVPAPWIYEARATYALTLQHDPRAQALNLLRAGSLLEATSVLKHTVGPSSVIAEDWTGLSTALSAFKEAGVSEGASNPTLAAAWRRGGGMYQDYLDLRERCRSTGLLPREKDQTIGATPVPASALPEIVLVARRILDALPANAEWGLLGLDERVATFEIRRVVGQILEAASGTSESKDGASMREAQGEDSSMGRTGAMVEKFYERAVFG